MTSQFVYYGGVYLGNQATRLGAEAGFASSAEKGTIATSGSLPVDDPGGSRNLVGLKVVQVKELACSTPTLWYGYASDRIIARGAGATDSLRTGADRRWDPQLVDVNAVFGFEVLHGTTWNRPAETDFARIAALLASGVIPIFDLGLVSSTGPVNLSAADYRGQTPANVMDDCANLSNRNYFAYWDDTNAKIGLFYQLPRYSGYQSTLRLTNVLADVDDVTTFEATASLNRNPQDVYSSVLVTYSGGQYFDTRASTASTFFERQAAVSQPNIKTLTHAVAFAERFLDDHATETDRLTVTAVKLPIAKVNLLLAGMDVQVRFSHLPSWGQGGSSYTYVRVAQRTAAADEESDQFYNMTLELQDGRATGGMGTALGNPDNTRVWPVNQEPFVPDCIGGVVTNLAPVYMSSHPYHVTASSPGDPTKLGTSYLATTVGGTHLQDDTNSFVTDSSAGDGTGWTQGDNGFYTVTTLPLGVPIHLYITYSAIAGSMYTDGATVFGLQSIPPNATGVSIASYAVGASSCGLGGTLDCGYFILSKVGVVSPTASTCNAPSVGQLIAEETAPPSSGATVFTTGYPYAPGSLHVFVGGVEWIPTETSPSAGTFTLASNPTPLLVTWTYIAADSTATGATVTSPPTTNPTYLTGTTGLFETTISGGGSVVKAHGSTGSTETFDPVDGNIHTATLDANCTITLTGPASGPGCTIELRLTQDGTGSRLVTWPGSVVWAGGTAPVLATAAAAVDFIVLETIDGGTTWYGFHPGGGSSLVSPLTTKGDIWAWSTTNARFPVGTNGLGIAADSTQTTGLRYVAFTGPILMTDGITSPPEPMWSEDGTDYLYQDL